MTKSHLSFNQNCDHDVTEVTRKKVWTIPNFLSPFQNEDGLVVINSAEQFVIISFTRRWVWVWVSGSLTGVVWLPFIISIAAFQSNVHNWTALKWRPRAEHFSEWSTLIGPDLSTYAALIGWILLCWRQGLCHNNTPRGKYNMAWYSCIEGHQEEVRLEPWAVSFLFKRAGVSNTRILHMNLGPGLLHSARVGSGIRFNFGLFTEIYLSKYPNNQSWNF